MDDTQNDIVESTNDTETTDNVIDESTAQGDDAEKLRELNKKLFERAKKAEAEAKALKAKQSEEPKPKAQLSESVNSDELRLIAKGLSDEEIDQAKVISKGLGVSLTEALKNPMFTAFQKEMKENARKEKARLGASKGSDQIQPNESGIKFGMTRDEHVKAFNESSKMIQT